MSPTTTAAPRPAITLVQAEAERLSALALRAEATAPEVAGLLLEEIERAELCQESEAPPDVVRMGSTVEFVDEAHGESRQVQLVYPPEADIGAGRISVLTPVGAGLIGLRPGQIIHWPTTGGQTRPLRIVRVVPPT